MSVYTFLEIDVNSQIEELRAHLKEVGAEISMERSVKGLEDDLHKIIGVCDTCFSADCSEHDIEVLLNSIVSVPVGEKTESLILAFCEKLAKAPSNRLGSVCLRVLNLLFQALPENLGVRYHVYYTMVQVSGQIGMIDSVYQSVEKLRATLNTAQPPPSTEQMQQLFRLLHQTLLQNKLSDKASKLMIELLGTYTTENASQAREDAHRCIIASLADPHTYIMDHLLSLKPVKFLEGELIHDLLTIFVSEKLPGYLDFYSNHKEFISSIGLDHEANIRKMRLLTFVQMSETNSEMSFDLIQQELQLGQDEVEEFIISVALKTRLVTARMDQSQRKVFITSVVHRTFGKIQWQVLKDTLSQWKNNLTLVKESMHTIVTAPLTPPAP
ncbi:Eukaryotic translation initiation factor 3 subunit M [Armadillidium nasatum]|uniref:Eukaryotic translation initiation factor 3 subunit M n=1 Tax=Armadillidium nasatum TaxID=96803 RepID=A0A5N5TEH9_9CRUS|nr:Eukaryotic translation initiation factor 3 subunit M [Armadillidium nasatum]